jgi:fibronectin-binding autotransporter adhesin
MIYYRNKRDIVFNSDTNSNFEDKTKFTPQDVPGGVGSTVVLTNSVQTGARTITVNQDVAVTVLKSENTTYNTALTVASGKKIYIKGLPGIDCKVIISGGTKTIAANFELQDNWEFDTAGAATLAALTLSGVISGNGNIIKKGGARLEFSGVNTFTGDIYLDAGQLRVSSDNMLGNSNNKIYLNSGRFNPNSSFTTNREFILQSASILNISAGTALTISGIISGNGNLTKDGATLILTNSNTFTGSIIVSAGTLSISSDSNLGNAANGVTLSGTTLSLTESITFSRTLTINTLSSTLNVASGKTVEITTEIQQSAALTKSGDGTLKFTAASINTGNNFLSQVSAGTVYILGTTATNASVTTISAGATMKGTGTIKKHLNISGTVEPGNDGVGTLTVQASLNSTITTMQSGSKLVIKTNGSSVSKLVISTGSFTANGTVDLPDSSLDTGTYDIVTWTGTAGVDNGITIGTNNTGKTCSLTYDGTNKKLQLVVT